MSKKADDIIERLTKECKDNDILLLDVSLYELKSKHQTARTMAKTAITNNKRVYAKGKNL